MLLKLKYNDHCQEFQNKIKQESIRIKSSQIMLKDVLKYEKNLINLDEVQEN